MKKAKNWKDIQKKLIGTNQKREAEIQLEQIKLDLAQLIYDSREEIGFTQSELASRMGLKQQYIAKIESGEANITLETLVRFLSSLKMVFKVEHVKRKRSEKVLQFLDVA